MPRKTRQLQWHKASRQWCKRYHGKLHYLGKGTPTNGGIGGRLDEQYDAALTKWESIKTELDAHDASIQRGLRIEDLQDELRLSDLRRSVVVNEQITRLEDGQGLDDHEATTATLNHVRLLAHRASSIDDWQELAKVIGGLDTDEPREPGFNSVAVLVDQFLEEKRLQESSGQRSAGRYVNIQSALTRFRDWVGGDLAVTDICSGTVSAYFRYILDRLADPEDGIGSTYTAKGYFQVAKQFIRWLAENEHISTLPANVNSRQLVIGVDYPNPRYLKPEQFRRVLEYSSPRSKLFWLLMVNAAMGQSDISALHPKQIDFKRGILNYKRTKLRRRATRKSRTYKLWPETIELLRELGKRAGDHVFLNRNGRPLVRRTIGPDGRPQNSNNITNAWDRAEVHAGITGYAPRCLRKTGATILRNSPFASKVGIYLQHRNNSIDDHYAADYDNTLDEALRYVRHALLIDGVRPSVMSDPIST